MEKNKVTLITIIILLFLFIPSTIIGLNKRFEEKNKKREFHYNGSLYFYNYDTLIGIYKCKTNSCDYAYYNIVGTTEKKQTKLINNQYAFISDGQKIYLEDIKNGWSINEYEELRSYHEGIENNSYITKSKTGWGIITMTPNLIPTLINKYDEVYFNYNNESKNISLDKIFVKEKELYKIIKNQDEIFQTNNKIVECNDDFVVISLNDNTYKLVGFDNFYYFEDKEIIKYKLLEDYVVIWTDYNLELYKTDKSADLKLNYISSYNIYADVKFEDNKLNVYEYEEIIDSIEL